MAKRTSYHFRGGLALPEHKEQSTRCAVERSPLPAELALPLQQHIGAPAVPVVAVGDKVLKGQCVARADGYISASVHASTSGTVVALEDRILPHPSGLRGPCIVIASDGEDTWSEPPPDVTIPTGALELRQRVRAAGLVGLGGAAFPTAVKLNPGPERSLELLLVNGAECEPYISCDDMLMREKAEEIVAGAGLLCRALAIPSCIVGVEDNKGEATAALEKAIAAAPGCAVEVHRVPTLYPAGGEKQLIQAVTGREVPSNGMPADIGILCYNAGTVVAIHDAVVTGRPLISRYVTVTGGGVTEPRNLEVLFGTPVRELIEFCGGYRSNAERLILGGPMMGFALRSDAVPVVKGTNCILVATAGELAPTAQPAPCIRCGDCVSVCPAQLLPQQLYWHARAEDFDAVQDYGLFDCIECGCCAAVCPSQLPLVDYYRYAKTALWAQERERENAETARYRYQLRRERVARNERQRVSTMQRKKAALRPAKTADAGNKSAFEAALDRVRGRAAKREAATDTPIPVSADERKNSAR